MIRDDHEKFFLRPEAPSNYGDKPVHVSHLSSIGTIAPLAHRQIHFNSLDDGSEWPFRLVQVMITPSNENESESFKTVGGGPLTKREANLE